MKKIIVKTIGPEVEKNGFVYGLDKRYGDKLSWGFTREVGNIKQMIIIQKSYFMKEVGLSFDTTAWKRHNLPQASFQDFYNDRKEMYLYETEEDIEKIMMEFVELIIKHGYKILEELSIEEQIIPTIEMADKLMKFHTELGEKFISDNKLSVIECSKENISDWFDIIEKNIIDTKAEPYESVQKMLVEIAAFIGEQLRKNVGGEWNQPEIEPRQVFLNGMDTFLLSGWGILVNVIEAWKNQSTKRLKQEYIYIIDGKMPMTKEQIKEYKANRDKYFA